ncbi:MAG: hypothetical protein Q4P07_06820 [Ornithinimicrobium sp.]|uniref:hypothetical protein n=1 Tax=Ornithinimicrobium sp. TaxID=1977084 RepID=UPI0026DF123B|nr:hypothetical protein [Ornithinimicrobium sp.]MDO5739845.1 hypothetical protein [Ornithinimicrobium sp.]
MTAVQAQSPLTRDSLARPRQWTSMTRLLLPDAARSLLIATVVMLALLATTTLFAWWRGWELVTMTDTDVIGVEVAAGKDGVTLVASLFLMPVAAGVAAVVMAIVLAARTRVFLAAGATRRSLATAHLVTLLVMMLYVLAVTAVVLLVVGRGTDGALDLVIAGGGADAVLLVAAAAGSVLMALVGASLITAIFLRWPWWVGVGALAVVIVLLPAVVEVAWPALADTVGRLMDWWGFNLVAVVPTAAIYWLVMRRMPVR